MRHPRRVTALSLPLALAMLLVGCGDDSDEPGASSTGSPSSRASSTTGGDVPKDACDYVQRDVVDRTLDMRGARQVERHNGASTDRHPTGESRVDCIVLPRGAREIDPEIVPYLSVGVWDRQFDDEAAWREAAVGVLEEISPDDTRLVEEPGFGAATIYRSRGWGRGEGHSIVFLRPNGSTLALQFVVWTRSPAELDQAVTELEEHIAQRLS